MVLCSGNSGRQLHPAHPQPTRTTKQQRESATIDGNYDRKADGMPIVAPMHTYVRNAVKDLGIEAPNLHIMPPQNYLFFGYLINKAKGIITDSGNVAEEATFLGIPCITLNTYAEHPETWRVGTNELVGEDPSALARAMDTLMKGEWKKGELPERWDGRTAERIVQILTNK